MCYWLTTGKQKRICVLFDLRRHESIDTRNYFRLLREEEGKGKAAEDICYSSLLQVILPI